METKKGILVFVLRSDVDCTNGGLTTKHDKFVLIGDGLPEIFEPSEDSPPLYLIRRKFPAKDGSGMRDYLHASTTPSQSGMFGGNFVYSSDSRFPNDYPISVHDRFERGQSWD